MDKAKKIDLLTVREDVHAEVALILMSLAQDCEQRIKKTELERLAEREWNVVRKLSDRIKALKRSYIE